MAETSIEWTERSWNPIVGCTIVSPGCTNCYAMATARRLERIGTLDHYAGLTRGTKAGPVWTGQIARASDRTLTEPLRRKKPTTYFVNSMGDLFHEDVPDFLVDDVFAVMALCPQHTFQVLTKRPARMRAYIGDATPPHADGFPTNDAQYRVWIRMPALDKSATGGRAPAWPLPNVWLGVSAEDQKRADERIPELLATPAAIRFVSAEPLLGPIDFRDISPNGVQSIDALSGLSRTPDCDFRAKLDWIIAGGESGPGARPMHPDWPRQIRDQCAAAGTSFFFKQWGEWCPISHMSEEQSDTCYFPAPQSRPEATRRERKPNCVLHSDGRRFDGRDRYSWGAFQQGSGAMTMFLIGKGASGRVLDGVQHNAMPEAR